MFGMPLRKLFAALLPKKLMPTIFHCTFSMLKILLQIYRFKNGRFVDHENILTTRLLRPVKFAYGNDLYTEANTPNCGSFLGDSFNGSCHRLPRKNGLGQ